MARLFDRRCWVRAASSAAACGGAAAQSMRANWPTKPIRAIVPIAPGTGADVDVPRWCSTSCRTGSASRSSSRTAAAPAARIGSAAVAKADPDGYTILAQSTSHTIAPAIYPNMPYDVTRDFVAVVPFGKMPTALIISPSKGIKTVQQLVAEAKAKPGALHLRLGRCRIDHASDRGAIPAERGHYRRPCAVPRRRLPPGGQRRAGSISPSRRSRVAMPDVRDGRLLALAVSARDRASALPGRADHARGRLPELRLCALARHVRAGEDAARHRRPAARREHQGAAVAGPARPARRARRRADGR